MPVPNAPSIRSATVWSFVKRPSIATLKSGKRCCCKPANNCWTSIRKSVMKYRIEMQPLAGRYVVALKDPETGDLVKTFAVNASAAEMIRLFRDGLDIEAIAQTLSDKYGVSIDRVRVDAEALLGKLG